MFKTANNDGISRPNSRPKLPFPGNGKGKFKMPWEGKGREIWGMYSRESRETGIPAHPCFQGGRWWLYVQLSFLSPNKILHLENLPFILQNYWFGSLALKGRNIPRQLDFRWKFPVRSFPSLGADNCSWCAAPESDSDETICEPELLPLNNFFADLKSISPFFVLFVSLRRCATSQHLLEKARI